MKARNRQGDRNNKSHEMPRFFRSRDDGLWDFRLPFSFPLVLAFTALFALDGVFIAMFAYSGMNSIHGFLNSDQEGMLVVYGVVLSALIVSAGLLDGRNSAIEGSPGIPPVSPVTRAMIRMASWVLALLFLGVLTDVAAAANFPPILLASLVYAQLLAASAVFFFLLILLTMLEMILVGIPPGWDRYLPSHSKINDKGGVLSLHQEDKEDGGAGEEKEGE